MEFVLINFFIISISNEYCTALVMKMSDVEGSADQDCRVHHKSGRNPEVRCSQGSVDWGLRSQV